MSGTDTNKILTEIPTATPAATPAVPAAPSTNTDFNSIVVSIISGFQQQKIEFSEARRQILEQADMLDIAAVECYDRANAQIAQLEAIASSRKHLFEAEAPIEESSRKDNTGDKDVPTTPRIPVFKRPTFIEDDIPNDNKYNLPCKRIADYASDYYGQTEIFEREVSGRKTASRKANGAYTFQNDHITLSNYARETARLKRFYQEDIKAARAGVTAAAGAPLLPDGIWTNILEGSYVDLEKINGSRGKVAVEEYSTNIGGIIIKTKDAHPKSTIKNVDDWLWCWDLYTASIEFTYPHRIKEFDMYCNHMRGMFRRHPQATAAVVLYDASIRIQAARSTSINLNNPTLHNDTYQDVFSSFGSQHAGIRGNIGPGARTVGFNSNEACRQWNRGQCSRPANACRFKHQCLDCSGPHPIAECLKTASGTGGRVPQKRNPLQTATSS